MPNFQITLVAYRDATVQAKDLETALQWRKNRTSNALFSEPSKWAFNGVFADYDNEASAEVHADGTHTVLEDDVLDTCDDCGGPLSGTGDDYCGLCPSCADQKYA